MVCPGYTEKSGAQVCCCFLREAYGKLLSMTAVFNMISSQSEAKSSVIHPRGDCQTVKNHAFIVVWYLIMLSDKSL